MTDKTTSTSPQDWWRTSIIDMAPGEIRYRGYAIEDMIAAKISFAETLWLLLRGELPKPGEAQLLECALMAGVDHGPQAPGIAIARMAASCGVGLNSAMAAGIGALGDVHGGAGEQAAALYMEIRADAADGDIEAAVERNLDRFFASGEKFVPGFGHRFHATDPRAPALMEVARDAQKSGVIKGGITDIALAIEASLTRRRKKPIPMNIDGATAVIFTELGFAPPLARGLFCIARSVGILAHAWEEMQGGERNKGPMPKGMLWSYDGPKKRNLPG